jgi:hypothetical protein
MRHSGGRFIAWFFSSLLLLGGSTAALNFVVDPLQYYRVSTLYKPVFWGGMQRYQNAGVARNYVNDVIVVGSSVTENFLTASIEREWGMKATRLSISGSTPHEQFLVTRLALRSGRVKHVLWGLDYGGFYQPARQVRDDQGGNFPHYLYRTGVNPNFEYLLSLGTTRLSVLALRGYGLTDLDRYHVWYDRFEFGERALLTSWRDVFHGTCRDFREKFLPGPETTVVSPSLGEIMKASFADNVMSLVHDYPAVQFDLFLPPMARIAYIPARTHTLPLLLPFRDHIVNEADRAGNIKLFDFQSVDKITDDPARFKDPIHFDLPTTEYIIRAIRDGKHLLGKEDLASRGADLVEQANRYDLCGGQQSPIAAKILRDTAKEPGGSVPGASGDAS